MRDTLRRPQQRAAQKRKRKSLKRICLPAGADSLSGSTPVQEVFTVKRIIRHPDFSWITAQNDIGLLELNGNVTLSRKVNLACLPPQGSRIPPGTPCVITGKHSLLDQALFF